jgi:hypothetical protein
VAGALVMLTPALGMRPQARPHRDRPESKGI